MFVRCLLPGLAIASLAALVACGGKVAVDASSGAGGSATTTMTGAGGCDGATFGCLQFCGSDFFPASAACVGGAWQCPPGTVDPSTCPSTGCAGPAPGACDVCSNGGWVCNPTPECFTSCPAILCGSCDGVGVLSQDCACSCDSNGALACQKTAQACCTVDWDCGDEAFVPCVSGVCKLPVANGCWSSEECNGLSCIGAFVCPCGADCDQPDHPGFCEGPP